MNFDDASKAAQEQLKEELQKVGLEHKLENLTAALIGSLLGVPIAVAKSGFQHGADAGPAGEHGRRFRLECKKYGDKTALGERELLGHIEQAIAADEALEAWVLVATRAVPEQVRNAIVRKGEREGIPVLTIDWRDHEIAPLAALCTVDPDTVASLFSEDAADLARALKPLAEPAILSLRRSLESWNAGFNALKIRSHATLGSIWSSPSASNALLGQDAAGGAQPKRIKRHVVSQALSTWWQDKAENDTPAAVVGLDGVGKTWAVLDWLADNTELLPIVLVAPSSAVASLTNASEMGVKQLLATLLHELAQVRDEAHWRRRLEHLLKRPKDEGPAITLWLDGLNQEPAVEWLRLLKILQGEAFSGRVRVIITVRPHFFTERLSELRSLTTRPSIVGASAYDTIPGGELDQMLAFDNLTQSDLSPDLIAVARVPRLFKIVVRLREKLKDAGTITVHRLLWEYGRDSFGDRASRSFSEGEWQDWLKGLARSYRAGVREFDLKSLSESASRPDLSPRDTYARLSDIIDGQFAPTSAGGNFAPSPVVVAHALGLALVFMLKGIDQPTHAKLETSLNKWLDPIAGLDERSELLRAAVSIQVDRDQLGDRAVTAVLLNAWLQGQNIDESHRRELRSLAPQLSYALLHTIEQSVARSQSSARLWSINALRSIPRTDTAAMEDVLGSSKRWASVLSRLHTPARSDQPDAERARSARLLARIGIDVSGPLKVLGVELDIVDYCDDTLLATIPALLEGYDLVRAMPVLEAAAVVASVRSAREGWTALQWHCLLNPLDQPETSQALRQLASEVQGRVPEAGIHSLLPLRVASLLLGLSGDETDEELAATINPTFETGWDYDSAYLKDPATSLYELERQHSERVLAERSLPASRRALRLAKIWLEPSFTAPTQFTEELQQEMTIFPVAKLNLHQGRSAEDHTFEELEPALARCAPELLAELIRGKYKSYFDCDPQSSYWKTYHATNHFLLAGKAEAAAAQHLRKNQITQIEAKDADLASNWLLLLEIKDLDAVSQIDAIIAADLDNILTAFDHVLRTPTLDEIEGLIQRYSTAQDKPKDDLLILLSIRASSSNIGDAAWAWIDSFTTRENYKSHGISFKALSEADPVRLGEALLRRNWTWLPAAPTWENHYGTAALIHASLELPFIEIAPRIAPWRLLEAVRLRGSKRSECGIAIAILDSIIRIELADYDPGATLQIDRTRSAKFPFNYSVEPRDDGEDPRSMFDSDAQLESHRRAVEISRVRIDEARNAGAALLMADIAAEDFAAALQAVPHAFDHWLDGATDTTPEFRQRVLLAEGAYLGLCEALLTSHPERGTTLWRALDRALTTRYTGAADVSVLIHMAFEAPDSAPVSELRRDLLDLTRSHSDLALFDLALAASYNGKGEWLEQQIALELSSETLWERLRGEMLGAFVAGRQLPVADAWPQGHPTTTHADRRRKCTKLSWSDACARHWWRCFLVAHEPADAYAAWVLFLESVDRRGWVWMNEDKKELATTSAFFADKMVHFQINLSSVRSAMKKPKRKLDSTFLTLAISNHTQPWLGAKQ